MRLLKVKNANDFVRVYNRFLFRSCAVGFVDVNEGTGR